MPIAVEIGDANSLCGGELSDQGEGPTFESATAVQEDGVLENTGFPSDVFDGIRREQGLDRGFTERLKRREALAPFGNVPGEDIESAPGNPRRRFGRTVSFDQFEDSILIRIECVETPRPGAAELMAGVWA